MLEKKLKSPRKSFVTQTSTKDVLASAARHLTLSQSVHPETLEAAKFVLSSCPNLRSLLLDGRGVSSANIVELLVVCAQHAKHLRRLTLTAFDPTQLSRVEEAPNFAQLTHLEMDKQNPAANVHLRLHLPALTHLLLFVIDQQYDTNEDGMDIPGGVEEDLLMFPDSPLKYFLLAFEAWGMYLTYETCFPDDTAGEIISMTSPHVVVGILDPLQKALPKDAIPNLLLDNVMELFLDKASNRYLNGRDIWEIVEEMVANRPIQHGESVDGE